MILYGVFRILSEQFREPDAQIGYLFNLFSMGSVLSFVMFVHGTFYTSFHEIINWGI